VIPAFTPPATPYAKDMDEKDFFDLDFKHMPRRKEVLAIRRGMSFAAIVDKIGKPHQPGQIACSFQWRTQEGESYYIQFGICQDIDPYEYFMPSVGGFNIAIFYNHGYASSFVMRYFEDSQGN